MKKTIIFIVIWIPLLLIAPHLASAQTPAPTSSSFVPLSDIPAITQLGSTPNLAAFLQQLYLICIGIAVVLAVLQLIRAGILYSMSDAITSKEEAKHLISASLLGLLLVLSPYIVFSIINPAILSLQINTSGIQNANPPTAPTAANTTACVGSGGTPGVVNASSGACDTSQSPPPGSKCAATGGGTGEYEPGKGCISTSSTGNGATICFDASGKGVTCSTANNGATPAPTCSATTCPSPTETAKPNGKGGCICS